MLITDEKRGIKYKYWGASSPRAVLLLIHGMGAHPGRWDFLADFFLPKGISSYAIELKGFGESKGLKGHIDSFDSYYDDIRRLRDIISRENPGKKIFISGESLGGLISFIMAVREPDLFDGLICVSPAFANRLKLTFLKYLQLFFASLFDRRKQFHVPFTSEMCTRDEHYRRVMDSEPREHRLATAKLLYNTLFAQMRVSMMKARLEIPVLFLLAGEDSLINPEKSQKIFARLESNDKNIIFYPGMYHALSIELGREKVFEDILGWISERV
ncbi:alpha/beta hydrolase [Candidatus Omnitrophota bacterium]